MCAWYKYRIWKKNLVHQYFLASFSYTNTCMHARMHTQIIVFLLANMLPILQSAHHFTQSINKHTMHDSIHSLISFSFPFSFGWFFDNDQTSNYSKFTVALSMISVFLNQSEQRELKFLYAFIRLQLSRVAFHFFLSKITAICSILWLGGHCSISIGVFVWRFTIQTPNKILSKNSLRIDLTAIPFVSTENRFHNTCRRNVFNGHIFEAKQLWFSTKILWFPKSSPQIRHLNCCNCVLFVDRDCDTNMRLIQSNGIKNSIFSSSFGSYALQFWIVYHFFTLCAEYTHSKTTAVAAVAANCTFVVVHLDGNSFNLVFCTLFSFLHFCGSRNRIKFHCISKFSTLFFHGGTQERMI